MPEPGSTELSPQLTEIYHSFSALESEFRRNFGTRDKTLLEERDERIKQRTLNLISTVRHYVPGLPEILTVFPGGTEFHLGVWILPVYLMTRTNQLVTGDFVPGFLGLRKPRIKNQKDVNTDGMWHHYGFLVGNALSKEVPGYERILMRKVDDTINSARADPDTELLFEGGKPGQEDIG